MVMGVATQAVQAFDTVHSNSALPQEVKSPALALGWG